MVETEPHRGGEQLVARRAHNPKVAGSSPAPATKKTQEPAYAGSFFDVLKIHQSPDYRSKVTWPRFS